MVKVWRPKGYAISRVEEVELDPDKEFYNPTEVGELVGVSPNTVRLWCKRGLLPYIRSSSGQILIKRDDLERFIKYVLLARVYYVKQREEVIKSLVKAKFKTFREGGASLDEEEVSLLAHILHPESRVVKHEAGLVIFTPDFVVMVREGDFEVNAPTLRNLMKGCSRLQSFLELRGFKIEKVNVEGV